MSSSARLIIVRHQGTGDTPDGEALCRAIRAQAGNTGQLVLLHDATQMALASAGYAGAFKQLDGELGARVERYVCAIPRAVPRMMAHTVAVVSSRQWDIFKTLPEALANLRAHGHLVDDAALERPDVVFAVEPTPAT